MNILKLYNTIVEIMEDDYEFESPWVIKKDVSTIQNYTEDDFVNDVESAFQNNKDFEFRLPLKHEALFNEIEELNPEDDDYDDDIEEIGKEAAEDFVEMVSDIINEIKDRINEFELDYEKSAEAIKKTIDNDGHGIAIYLAPITIKVK